MVQAKLDKLLKIYKKCVKQGNYVTLNDLFDITKENGEWLCNEDKKLYRLQVQSNGQTGYKTGKAVRFTTIHPSKKRKMAMKAYSTTFTSTTSTASSLVSRSESSFT